MKGKVMGQFDSFMLSIMFFSLAGCGLNDQINKDEILLEQVQMKSITYTGILVNITGVAGDGERTFFLSLPQNYDPKVKYKLIIGYAGTNWTGKKIQPYFGMEQFAHNNEIFVYPDPLWREFKEWGKLGGWVMGPHAYPANGMADIRFTEAIIDYMEKEYSIDSTQIFVTGHSWGGDMAAVVACFLGDRIRAAVPIAANEPYWFRPADNSAFSCNGNAAVWTLFGQKDSHFTWQAEPGQFGNEQVAFWLEEKSCTGIQSYKDLNIGEDGECLEYTGCSANVRYCLYNEKFGHQKPDYFAKQVMKYFRSFSSDSKTQVEPQGYTNLNH